MDEKVQYCYSCHHRMMFDLFGQTKGYDEGKQAEGYIKRYLEEGQDVVKCDLCDREVIYIKEDGNLYLEAEKKSKGESDQ